MKKFWLIALGIVALCGTAFAVAQPSLAQDNASGALAQEEAQLQEAQVQPARIIEVISGTILGVDIDADGNGVITLEGLDEPVIVTAETLYRVAGWRSWSEDLLSPQDRVTIILEDGISRQVIIHRPVPVCVRITGTVTEVTEEAVVVTDTEGREIVLDREIVPGLEVGDYVNIAVGQGTQAGPVIGTCPNFPGNAAWGRAALNEDKLMIHDRIRLRDCR